VAEVTHAKLRELYNLAAAEELKALN